MKDSTPGTPDSHAPLLAGGTTDEGIDRAQVREPWHERLAIAELRQPTLRSRAFQYGLPVVSVAMALGLRLVATVWVGRGLPTYITFFPAVMAVAVLAGLGPGLLATLLTDLVVVYWLLPPMGQLSLVSPVEGLGLVIFTAMGLFMSVVAEIFRRDRDKAAAYDREAVLRESRGRLAAVAEQWEQTFNTVPDFIAILDTQHRVIRVNRPMAERLGVTPGQCIGMHCYEAVHGTTEPHQVCPHRQTCQDQQEHTAEVYEPRLGGHFLVSTTPQFDQRGRFVGAIHIARDITKRKHDEQEREMAAEFLRLMNESRGKENLIRASVAFFQEKAGCEAVGIRLREGDDYPYYETRGFPAAFLRLENRLCACDDAGQPLRDATGNPVLDCMCGNVICERFDPSQPFFTTHGSFWTNSTSALLATTTEGDRQARTRNRCNGQGYESVALIALAAGADRLGLLQLNDRRKDCFTAEGIALWERLAGYLAVALAKTLAEEAQHDSQERLKLHFENTPLAVIEWGPDFRLSRWSLEAERIFGWRAEEVIGKRLDEFRWVYDEDVAGVTQISAGLVDGTRSRSLNRNRNYRKDGSVIHCEWYNSSLRDQSGKLRSIMSLVLDVTEREEVAEQLKAAKEAAEAANAAKSQFLASMSHELRTPMNAILGMTDLALGEPLPSHVRDYLQTSKESADLLLELLNEILDFSRIEAGRFELESTPFQLRRTIEQVVKSLRVRAYEKGLEMVCQVADDLPEIVLGDPLRLRQVLMNLVSNAVKFTPKGEVVLRVEREVLGLGSSDLESDVQAPGPKPQDPSPKTQDPSPKSQDPRPCVRLTFSVSDTGIGIPAEKLESIFAPFTQADASTTRRFGGTGLGLAIAQRLVNLMGGEIHVESQSGSGSTFRFTLTLPIAERAKDDGEAAAGDRDLFRDLPAIVIGESATSRKILQQTLASWWMQVDEAPDVPTGLTKIHEAAAAGRAYRLVLADAFLPGIDGFTLVEWLKQDARLAGPAILILSATDRQRYPDRCRELTAPCLEKPVSRSELFSMVAKALGGQGLVAPKADREEAGGWPASRRIIRILVAEDTPANQKVVRHVLGNHGHHLEIAENGRQALALVEQQDFDVVLMDVQMPEMDGLQATAAIRRLADAKKARVPIVAMTAHALKGDRERCLAAGMDDYLSKPIKREELIETVERMAERRS